MIRLPKRFPIRGWRRWLIVVAVLFPIVNIGVVEMTSQSWFCNSCHIMNPYHASWKTSAHKNVECIKCHINPGVDGFLEAKFNGLGQVVDDVLHRTSMKPSASVSQMACTRSGCHDLGKVRQTNKTEGKYLFRHDKHLDLTYEGIKVACTTCHSHVKGSEHFEVNTNICVTCHLLEQPREAGAVASGKPPAIIRLAVRETSVTAAPTGVPIPRDATPTIPAGDAPAPVTGGASDSPRPKIPPSSCAACHNPPSGTIERGGLKITHSEYLAYGAKCESCHKGTTAAPVPIDSGQCLECHNFGLEKLTSVEEMHKVHSEGRHKIECFSCHGTVQHGPTAQTAAMEQFDCRKCHVDQHGVQRRTYLHSEGQPTHEGAAAVSPMFLAHVDCTGCHIKQRPVSVKPDSGAMVAAAVPEACDRCHKPGFGGRMIPLWQKAAKSLYSQVAEGLKATQADQPGESAKPALAEVQRILEMVKVDGSWGVHNPRYTQQLLEQARDRLTEVRGLKPQGNP